MLMGCPQSLKVNEDKVGKRKEINLSGFAFSEDPNHLYGNGREEVEIDHFSKNWLDALWTRLNHWINHLTATLQTWINPCKLSFPLNIPYSLSPTWYTAKPATASKTTSLFESLLLLEIRITFLRIHFMFLLYHFYMIRLIVVRLLPLSTSKIVS